MRIPLLIAALLLANINAWSWGQNGHRAVGHIAEKFLKRKAKKKLCRILENQSLSYVSVWMDDIKSDRNYDYAYTWHFVTVPDGETYDVAEKADEGDIIMTIERLISELEAGGLSAKQEQEHVKMLVHLIGDIHQPLHVGTGEDKGGNDVKVTWFNENSNLHRVWDSDMIESKQLSFTELAHSVLITTKEQVRDWQDDSVRDWAIESIALREDVYDIPENKRLGYRYMYENWPHVERRIFQAGVRLATILNNIYG
jgi:hypothetical protein